MTENTHQNFCERADELVSYLYGEASATEKSLFEAHLADCAACASELSDFSLVRSSIVKWRDTAFQPLTTPIVELSSIHNAHPAAEALSSESLLTRIRAFFALSPVRICAAAAAALVICAGLWFAATNFQRTENIAQVEKDRETISVPANKNIAELKTVNSEEERQTVSDDSSKPPLIETKEINSKKETGAVKVSQTETAKPKKAEAEKSLKPTKPVLKKSNQSPPPTLLADDDDSEDDSLRLSDLFREVGS